MPFLTNKLVKNFAVFQNLVHIISVWVKSNYKGGLYLLWVLRFQDKTAGSSIHKVIKKIDSGELIDEVKFDINTNSMHFLMLKTMNESSGMINRAINNILNEKKQGNRYY